MAPILSGLTQPVQPGGLIEAFNCTYKVEMVSAQGGIYKLMPPQQLSIFTQTILNIGGSRLMHAHVQKHCHRGLSHKQGLHDQQGSRGTTIVA
jgi:hypothetical protein